MTILIETPLTVIEKKAPCLATDPVYILRLPMVCMHEQCLLQPILLRLDTYQRVGILVSTRGVPWPKLSLQIIVVIIELLYV